ncbi:MAG: hypothetical protein WD990_09830 [Acidimicrobiia bacterium]
MTDIAAVATLAGRVGDAVDQVILGKRAQIDLVSRVWENRTHGLKGERGTVPALREARP